MTPELLASFVCILACAAILIAGAYVAERAFPMTGERRHD